MLTLACLMCWSSSLLAAHGAVREPGAPQDLRPSFQGLGHLPGGEVSWAVDLSLDGSVVVGSSENGTINHDLEAFVWSAATGMVGLGDFNGGLVVQSSARAVSADGRIVVGTASGSATGGAFRWTAQLGLENLGDWVPLGISADGGVLVGVQGTLAGNVAVRWTEAGGIEDLGSLPGSNVDAFLADCSADGSVAAGQSWSGESGVEPVRWTAASGLVGLGDLPGGLFYGLGFGISDDGGVVVGEAISDIGWEAFRWTPAIGLESLDPLGRAGFSSFAHDVTADGSIVAGFSGRVGGAALWDERHGYRSVQSLLEAYGVDLGGWTLAIAEGVTRTATHVIAVGYGTNPDGNTEAWIARIPRRRFAPFPRG